MTSNELVLPTKTIRYCWFFARRFFVGVAGFEPTASSSRTKRATKLRHTPDGRRSV